ncbi:MAG: hypothetical protein JKY60_10565 [Kordiimonadaceae bacterium]|nr:hypothetical protein [Kordiimonadaceae bacterium]
MSSMALIVDGVLALLLVAAIVACVVVYRRLGTIRAGQAELKTLVDDLNRAVSTAQRSVVDLKNSAGEVESRLRDASSKASAMSDELSFITESGNNLADRIERGLVGAGKAADRDIGAVPKAKKKQQQEILAALREAR